MPAYVGPWLDWLGAIQVTAWGDREAMAQVHDEEHPLTAQDLDDFGRRVAFARKINIDHSLPTVPSVGRAPAVMTDDEVWLEMLTHRGVLCDALSLLFAKLPESRHAVTEIRAARTLDEIPRANERLLRMLENEKLAARVCSLPKGEAHALTRMRELVAEWTRRAKGLVVGPKPTGATAELRQRALTLAYEKAPRVLFVGRYLTKGNAARKGDYAGFRAPKPTGHAKVNAPVTPTATMATAQGAPVDPTK